MTAFLSATRTFALRFTIALVASFLVLNAALYAADRVAATKISEATPLHFRQNSLHDSGQADSAAEPANFLIVGSDTRGFVHSAVDVSHFGSASADPGARSDTLMIAHIDPNIKQALIVSFPRDLEVTLPGGCRQKINAAYNQDFRCNSHSPYGGPQQIVDTLKNDFNIDINHYVEVNFPGFRQMVDVLGTVPIYFPAKARDVYTGLHVDGGCQNLTGLDALGYVRSRHYEYFDYQTGRWVPQAESDLARIRRQQYFIRTLLQTAINKGFRNPFTALRFAGKMARSVAVDSKFGEGDLKRLISTFRFTDPGAVQMLTVPTVPGSGGLVLASDAETVLSRLRTFAPKPAAPPTYKYTPAQVKIEVRNGSGVGTSSPTTVAGASSTAGATTGAAATTTSTAGASGASGASSANDAVANRAASLLEEAGFTVAVGPAQPETSRTEIEYTPQAKGKVLVLVAHMARAPKLHEVAQISGGADLVFVVGHDGSGLIDPNAAPTTTTTTAPPSNGGPATTTTTVPPNPGTPPQGTPASSVKSQWIGCQ